MNRYHDVSNVGIYSPSTGELASIDALRVLGPARERIRRRFGAGRVDALEKKLATSASSIDVGMATDKGLRRQNEDSAIVIVGTEPTVNAGTPIVLAAVADGMGGHEHGDRAGAVAIETLADYAVHNIFLSDADQFVHGLFEPAMIDDMLTDCVMQAHSAIRQEVPGGGSTLTCALLLGDTLFVAHVGDSRAYLVKAGSVDILTHDHRLTRKMEDVGILTRDEAAHHPQRHVLFRALGMEEEFEVDVTRREITSAGRLLLCTDGVWEPLNANDIYMWVLLGRSPQDICERLIRDAILRKANDNATAVLLHLPGR